MENKKESIRTQVVKNISGIRHTSYVDIIIGTRA